MKLYIRPFTAEIARLYRHHSHFHPGDAGLDLFVPQDYTIEPGASVAIHLGIACASADGRAYWLIPRSSISKTPLRMANSIGLIDGGYRGELMAVVDNIKDFTYTVTAGTRLFQLVAMDGSPIEFELVEQLDETSRGAGGFGSTGR